MGSAIGAAFVEAGHDVSWLPAGRSAATAERARAAGMIGRTSLSGCELLISVCPPSAAIETARAVAERDEFSGVYLDANATSPQTAAVVAGIVRRFGGAYVDGGVIGPPPLRAGTSRLYVSGARAAEVAGTLAGSRLEVRVLDGAEFDASSLKMAYASWTKISAALLLAVRATAGELGVEEALVEEWALSQPDLDVRLRSAQTAAQSKGWRWEGEMREIAETFREAGQPDGFGGGAATVFGRYPRP